MARPADTLAIVTGGAFGIGVALSKHLLAAGYQVLACGRTQERLDEARKALSGLRTVRVDVTVASDRERLFEEAVATSLPVDMLVNNAGVSNAHDYTNVFTLREDRARSEIETNFAAPVELVRLYLLMRRERGWEDRPATIANISSPGGLFPMTANPLYAATKGAFHIFSAALRRQLADTPVDVVEVFPPSFDTALAHDLESTSDGNGLETLDAFVRASVEEILAGNPVIAPPPMSLELVEKLLREGEAAADAINPRISRKDGWDRKR